MGAIYPNCLGIASSKVQLQM